MAGSTASRSAWRSGALIVAAGTPALMFAGAGAAGTPTKPITIISPRDHASYERGSRVLARFRCNEGGIIGPIATCTGTVRPGDAINTRSVGIKRFTVIATDTSGNTLAETVPYTVWAYTNPLRAVRGLRRRRIDMGVDYSGQGPIMALGDGRVAVATNNDSGPPSCWGRSCWPGGGVVVYRLSNGPFAGKFVYVAENITVRVHRGQTVHTGQEIATLHDAYPNLETGWASGNGPKTLAIANGHQCTCGDPGGWSSVEGRDFNRLLVALGAPSGYLQPSPPHQSMPRGWPRLRRA